MTRLLKTQVMAMLFVFVGVTACLAAQVRPDAAIGGLTAKFADVGGIKTRYYEMGSGEPMVLVHGGFTGGSSTANVWSRNLPGLAKRFHVYAPDRPGSGMTGNPLKDADYNHPGDAQFIYDFIQTMKLGKVHLVGHSAGGGISFYLAVQHPEVVKTLTIIAQGPEDPSDKGPVKLANLLKTCPDQTRYEGLRCRVEVLAWSPHTFDDEYWAADVFMANQPKNKEARAKVNAGAGEPLRTNSPGYAAWREKIWDKVRNEGVLQMPVLMYAGKEDVIDWGENDPASKLEGELGLFDIIGAKNPRLQMIVDAQGGHFMYREHPELFNRQLTDFIDYWEHQPPAAEWQIFKGPY